jgi:predicted DNA-binding transcriptional regulator AlpA
MVAFAAQSLQRSRHQGSGEIKMADGAQNTGTSDLRTQLRNPAGLRQLVGYSELVKAAGVSRSTIERAWRGPWKDGEPRLPAPGKIGSRAVWTAAEVDAWLLARATLQRAAIANLARDNPEDLAPDQLEAHGQEWLRRTVSKFAGDKVDLKHVHIGYRPPLTEAEDDALFSAQVDALEDKFADLDETDSAIVVAWLFPAMRPWFNWPDAATKRSMNDPVQLRSLALRALDGDE